MKAGTDNPHDGTGVGDLVAWLRDAWTADRLPHGKPPGPERPSLRRVVEALREVERGNRGTALRPEPAASTRYDRVRQIFQRREEAQRAEALLVDRILDRVRAGAAPRTLSEEAVLQQTVRIACPAGGRSAGRFLVVNETGAKVRVRPAIGLASLRAGGPVRGAALLVEPGVIELEPSAACEAELRVDLRNAVEARAGEPIDVAIALRDEARSLGRVWAEIVVVEPVR